MIYDTISKIIDKVIKDDEFKARDNEDASIFEKILKTDGLDIKDKICGIIGMELEITLWLFVWI